MTQATASPASPPPPAPYGPAWMLHEYHGVAYLCFNGRLVVTATLDTPAQEAHVERLFRRLDRAHAAHRVNPADERVTP